jgi:autotransporter-associated beta strand protein
MNNILSKYSFSVFYVLLLGGLHFFSANAYAEDPCSAIVVDGTLTANCAGPLDIYGSIDNIDTANYTITSADANGMLIGGDVGDTLLNSGTIDVSLGSSIGTDVYGIGIGGTGTTINALINGGIITIDNSGGTVAGIYQNANRVLTTLTNTGSINANGSTSAVGNVYGISNFGTIGDVSCDGSSVVTSCSTAGLLLNSGSIYVANLSSAGSGTSRGINNADTNVGTQGTIYRIDNTGSISAYGNSNDGVYGTYNAIGIYNHNESGGGAYIGVINNTGTITSDRTGINNNLGNIDYINNTGTISITDTGLFDAVTAGTPDVSAGIINYGGNIGEITNSGVISVNGDNRNGIINTGFISSILNTGTIGASSTGGYSIVNTGTIATLSNSQSSLSYYGVLPTSYNIIINSASDFGAFYSESYNVSGATSFGIHSDSIISNGTYGSVIFGLSSSFFSNSSITNVSYTSSIYGTGTWTLSETSSGSTLWNLTLAGFNLTDVASGDTVALSDVGSTYNAVFDGGSVSTSDGDSSSSNFVVTANGGTVTAPTGGSATLSGIISGAGAMTIDGAGTVIFSGINSYTGATTLDTGATLSLTGDGSIAASSSLLNNGSFDISGTTSGTSVQAILGTGTVSLGSQDLTITNATGDLSGAIDGTGGISITGGTQTLSGINSYTGATIVSGGALELTGSLASTEVTISSGSLNVTNSGLAASTNLTVNGGATNLYSNQSIASLNGSGGTVSIDSGSALTLTSGGSYDGVVAGSGSLVIVGGTNYFDGNSTLSGGTSVTGGTLSIGSSESTNTASLAGDVAVATAGTLAGHGSIGGSVTNSGVVAPGGSIGTLTVNGNYAQNSSATLMTTITPTENSVLAVTGTAALAGTFQIDAENGTYGKRRYTVLTSSGLSGTFSNLTGNLAAYSALNAGLSYDANNAYLTLYAGTADTQQSIANTASALQPIYTLQNTVLANSFSYDCSLFGKNGVCISAGGRNTAVQAANGLNNTSGLLIASYRLDKNNSRIGAYADQNLSVNNAGSTVNLGNNTPLVGLFGVWSQRPDAIGAEVKVSAAYGQKDTTITRQVVGTSDPGSGSSTLNSQGAQVVAKYGFGVAKDTVVSPYVGMRYTQNNMGGYTEGSSSTVTAPLTYSALNTNATTALAGVGVLHSLNPKTILMASAGVESDTNTANGSYYGTNSNIAGLTAVNFNANPVTTRPTASLGAYYSIEKNQRLGITGIYRQEPFQAVSTTTVMATYTIGL